MVRQWRPDWSWISGPVQTTVDWCAWGVFDASLDDGANLDRISRLVMPRFTVKDLLIATTLIAIGTWMFAFLAQNFWSLAKADARGVAWTLWFGGGAFVGAGLGKPFKRAALGAAAVFVVQVVVMVYAIAYWNSM